MPVRDTLRTILDGYVRARQTEAFPGAFRVVFDRLEQEVAALPSVRAAGDLRVRAGFGVGQWSRTPWLTILDPRETASPQQGVAVIITFRQDMAGVFLTLGQGHARDIAERGGRRAARALWAERAASVRALAGGLTELGFQLDGGLNQGLDDGNAAADAAASTIAWIYFPGDALPDDQTLDRMVEALLGVYVRWLESRPPRTIELSRDALDEMRRHFLAHMTGFVNFAEPGAVYESEERAYKVELAEVFRAEVLPLFTGPLEDAAAAEAAIQALNHLLTRRRLGAVQDKQNLLSWHGTEHLARLRGEEALHVARLYRDLLASDDDAVDRVERFNAGYVPILRRYMRSGYQGASRSLPTLLLMLADPAREIYVRTTLFDDAARRLLGHRLLSPDPLTAGDYAACRALAQAVKAVLEEWGWRPRDMIDVQGFLWVADPSTYGAAPAPEDAFRDALDPQSGRRIFKIAPGERGRHWEDCRAHGYICVGWDDLGDLREFPPDAEAAFVEAFRTAYPDDYSGSSARLALGTRKARELWTVRDLQPGDIVLANRGVSEVLAMGEVVEPGYVFDDARAEYKHTVSVRWNEGLRRDLAGILPAGVRAVWMNSTLSPVDREVYAAILEGLPAAEPAGPPSADPVEEPSEPAATDAYAEPPFAEIVTSIAKMGLKLPERLLRRYHAALRTRGFVILAGVSGTGKTWLAEAYAAAAGAERLIVPVAPNWTSNEDLLGYVSPTTGAYRHTEFSRFLLRAARAYEQAPDKSALRPHHVILDEMNLARVEHYFADFLSVLEQRKRYGQASLTLGDAKVGLYPNLVFVGTVNMDETTHGFAHKVYDRAQLIEVELDPALFAAHVAAQPYADDLVALCEALKGVAPFAMRTADEIAEYVAGATALGAPWQDAFDEAVMQKVLPRVRGFDPAISDALGAVVERTRDRFPLSHAKAARMLEGLRLGVVSFF